jgi:hypothetical protein
MKNPPTVFARQANIRARSQQVNNAFAPGLRPPSRAGNQESVQNELLEVVDGELLDGDATEPAVGSDPTMAPVAEA